MKEFTSVTLEDGDEAHSDELPSSKSQEVHGGAGGHDHHDVRIKNWKLSVWKCWLINTIKLH